VSSGESLIQPSQPPGKLSRDEQAKGGFIQAGEDRHPPESFSHVHFQSAVRDNNVQQVILPPPARLRDRVTLCSTASSKRIDVTRPA
jgi:hypothetical protein